MVHQLHGDPADLRAALGKDFHTMLAGQAGDGLPHRRAAGVHLGRQRVFAEQLAGQQRKINDLPPHLAVHRIAAVHFGAHWLRHGGSLALRAAAVYAYK